MAMRRGCSGWRRAIDPLAAARCRLGAGAALGFVEVGQDAHAAPVERAASGRELELPGGAVDRPRAQALFQARDQLADGRGRHAAGACGGGEAAQLDDAHEHDQFAGAIDIQSGHVRLFGDFNSQVMCRWTVYCDWVFEFMISSWMTLEFTAMKRPTRPRSTAALLALALAAGALSAAPMAAAAQGPAPAWVASWQASAQPVWDAGFLFPTHVPGELRDQTVRQVARISLGGPRLRIVLSNAYGRQPVAVGRATLARPAPGDGAVDDGSLRTVTFAGQETATLLPGAALLSDPVDLPLPALARVAVSVYLPHATPLTTFHWDGRQTGWIVAGDQTGAAMLPMTQRAWQRTTARPLLTGIQVEVAAGTQAVAVIGDSITDGAMASLDADRRWPDFLAERLAPQGVAVVNAGISGARLLSDGMGVNALARLERDVLAQPGVRSVIVMLGINDIGWPGTAFARDAPPPTLEALAMGYRQLIEQARSRGLRVIGATLAPFQGALPGTPLADYYQPGKDALRQRVNDWIRHAGAFDAVIDFDAVLRDPAHPARMAAPFDSGDRLHPGDAGNRAMAQAVDLAALLPALAAVPAAIPSTTPGP